MATSNQRGARHRDRTRALILSLLRRGAGRRGAQRELHGVHQVARHHLVIADQPARLHLVADVEIEHTSPPQQNRGNAVELEATLASLEENRKMLETKFPRDLENTKSGRFFGWTTLTLGIDTLRVRAKWCRFVARQLASEPKKRTR